MCRGRFCRRVSSVPAPALVIKTFFHVPLGAIKALQRRSSMFFLLLPGAHILEITWNWCSSSELLVANRGRKKNIYIFFPFFCFADQFRGLLNDGLHLTVKFKRQYHIKLLFSNHPRLTLSSKYPPPSLKRSILVTADENRNILNASVTQSVLPLQATDSLDPHCAAVS